MNMLHRFPLLYDKHKFGKFYKIRSEPRLKSSLSWTDSDRNQILPTDVITKFNSNSLSGSLTDCGHYFHSLGGGRVVCGCDTQQNSRSERYPCWVHNVLHCYYHWNRLEDSIAPNAGKHCSFISVVVLITQIQTYIIETVGYS
jgi:hypothetical protein